MKENASFSMKNGRLILDFDICHVLFFLSGITKSYQTGMISAHILKGVSLEIQKENSLPLWDHLAPENRLLWI